MVKQRLLAVQKEKTKDTSAVIGATPFGSEKKLWGPCDASRVPQHSRGAVGDGDLTSPKGRVDDFCEKCREGLAEDRAEH